MVNVMPIAAELVRKATLAEVDVESPLASTRARGAARGRIAPRVRQGGADLLRRLADRVEPEQGVVRVGDPLPGGSRQ